MINLHRKMLLLVLSVFICLQIFAQEGGEVLKTIEIITPEFVFQATVAGSPEHEAVILLHGFPETSYMWRDLQSLLSGEGFYTVAPDQRGYSPQARPKGKKNYAISLLAEDVIAMADSLGINRFHLVGHDWGSAVGWFAAAAYPERIISWSALSVPHLTPFADALVKDPEQHSASSYMRLFQWPFLPEIFLKRKDFKNLRSIWEYSEPAEMNAYLSIFEQKGAVTAALNWYRANYRPLTKQEMAIGPVKVPTLFIWGQNDSALLKSSVQNNAEFVDAPYSQRYLDAGHWLIQEKYREVSNLIIAHLKKNAESVFDPGK